ncbi:MAG: aminopeptidase [Chloroflexi bacterium]|nr:aminopeptidase [Chloroflexota bacterium]
MMDPRTLKHAEILVNYCTEVKQGDLVMIHPYDLVAEPLALAVYQQVLEAGGHAVFNMRPNAAQELLLKSGSNAQLDRGDPYYHWLMENIDVRIAIKASSNTRSLSNVDPARQARYQKALTPARKLFFDRQAAGEMAWVVTQYPALANAQDAEMSLMEYQDFVYQATMTHLDDPVGAWQEFSERQQKLVDWLAGKKQISVKGENIDLTLSIAGRSFINADGRRNLPDGEIFTGPVEDSVNGWVRFTYPAIYNSREVDGVELTFEEGKVVKATAAKGEDYLNSVLDTDDGARYLGEFAIGTNSHIQQFTRNILFDEKIGGTVHMAVGASYPDTGGKNQSAVHWDMICDMRSGGEIQVDGELFYKDGGFQLQ